MGEVKVELELENAVDREPLRLGHIKEEQLRSPYELENVNREFKQLIDNPESVAGEIVAFANSDGGVLYVGVDDDGHIVGLSDANATFQSLTHICRDRCIPPISPVIEQFTISGQEIVVLTVMPGLNRQKPYRTAGGRFYIRVGKDKKDATSRELMRIVQAAGELHYDESPVYGTGLADLSLSAFSAYHQLQFGMTLDEQLEQLPCPFGHHEERK